MKKLISSLVVALFVLSGCGDDKKETTTSSTMEKVKQEVTPVVQTVKEETNKAMDAVEKEVEPMVEKAKESLSEVKEMADENAKEVTQVVEESVAEAKALVASTDSEAKGAQLFVKCAACHGKNAEKKALGTSQIIQGWDKEKIIQALNGYKNNTYGTAMKTVMIGQVATLSDEDIAILAEYISGL